MLDCVVLAGGHITPTDPLYRYTNGKPKAYIPLEGRTMLEWVIDALQASDEIADLCIVGVPTLDGLSFREPVHFLPDQGDIVQNAEAGVAFFRERGGEHVLICTADIPLISPSAISSFIDLCLPLDCAAYAVVHRREDMESRYPRSGRSFFKLREMEVTLSNVGIAHTKLLDTDPALWAAVTNARKHPWQVARVIGIGTLLKFLFRRVSLEDMSATASRTIDQSVCFVFSDAVELGMDADTPDQVELIRTFLRRQTARVESTPTSGAS